MFDLVEIVNYLTYLTYLGFIISSFYGFSKLGTYDGQLFIISLCALVNTLFYGVIDIFKVKSFEIIQNYYIKSYFMLNISALILAINPVGIGCGIWGIIISVTNFFVGIFNSDIENKVASVDETSA